jgi:hypothetical protein
VELVIAAVIVPVTLWVLAVWLAVPGSRLQKTYLRMAGSRGGWIITGLSRRITPRQNMYITDAALFFGAIVFSIALVVIVFAQPK